MTLWFRPGSCLVALWSRLIVHPFDVCCCSWCFRARSSVPFSALTGVSLLRNLDLGLILWPPHSVILEAGSWTTTSPDLGPCFEFRLPSCCTSIRLAADPSFSSLISTTSPAATYRPTQPQTPPLRACSGLAGTCATSRTWVRPVESTHVTKHEELSRDQRVHLDKVGWQRPRCCCRAAAFALLRGCRGARPPRHPARHA